MPAYGNHPTIFSRLSNEELYSMFREETYRNLNVMYKHDLLQETVNRDALERGMVGSPKVEFANLEPGVSGQAGGGVIKVDFDMAVNGITRAQIDEQTVIDHNMDDFNIQTLNTILHENTHCFQDQITDGTISISDQRLTAEYMANTGAPVVLVEDGAVQIGSDYMRGVSEGGYNFYYFQPTERDAYLYAEAKTDNIIGGLRSKYGNEPSFDNYDRSVMANGYQAQLNRAAMEYGNPNFDKEVSQSLMNHRYGTNVPVDPAIEEGVRTEMVASFEDAMNSKAEMGTDIYSSVSPGEDAAEGCDDGIDI